MLPDARQLRIPWFKPRDDHQHDENLREIDRWQRQLTVSDWYRYDFTYTEPNLTTGVPFMPVTKGDLILNAFFVVSPAWVTAHTALGDFDHTEAVGVAGFFNAVSSWDMKSASVNNLGYGSDTWLTRNQASFDLIEYMIHGNYPLVPMLVTTNGHLQFWVTQTGLIGGADPAASAGKAALFVEKTTPNLLSKAVLI